MPDPSAAAHGVAVGQYLVQALAQQAAHHTARPSASLPHAVTAACEACRSKQTRNKEDKATPPLSYSPRLCEQARVAAGGADPMPSSLCTAPSSYRTCHQGHMWITLLGTDSKAFYARGKHQRCQHTCTRPGKATNRQTEPGSETPGQRAQQQPQSTHKRKTKL